MAVTEGDECTEEARREARRCAEIDAEAYLLDCQARHDLSDADMIGVLTTVMQAFIPRWSR